MNEQRWWQKPMVILAHMHDTSLRIEWDASAIGVPI